MTEPAPEGNKDRPVHVIGCRVLEHALRPLLSDVSRLAACRFLDCGLHTVPERLTEELQDAVDALEEPGYVVLGYGLCGNGLVGLQSGGHTLIVPRVDDCIPLLLGSYQVYRNVLQECTGTYFLSRGWLSTDQQPLAQLSNWSAKYGRRTAERLIDRMYAHYERVVFIAMQPSDLDDYRCQGRAVAELLGVDYVERTGSSELLKGLLQCRGDGSYEDYIFAPPGATLTQRPFLRA